MQRVLYLQFACVIVWVSVEELKKIKMLNFHLQISICVLNSSRFLYILKT